MLCSFESKRKAVKIVDFMFENLKLSSFSHAPYLQNFFVKNNQRLEEFSRKINKKPSHELKMRLNIIDFLLNN